MISVVRKASGIVMRRFALDQECSFRIPRSFEEAEDVRVVESALEPLDTGGHQRVLLNRHQVPRQRADTFTSHRVPLVRHGTRSDLVLLEGLLDLLEVREQSDVGRDLVRGGSEGREGTENVNVDLARVGLARDRVGVLEAREFRNELVEFLDLEKRYSFSGRSE